MSKNNIETLGQDFYEFMCERQDAAWTEAEKDKRYIKVKTRLAEILVELEKLTSKEFMMELDRVEVEEMTILKDYAYRQGFFDGLRFTQLGFGPINYRSQEDYEK